MSLALFVVFVVLVVVVFWWLVGFTLGLIIAFIPKPIKVDRFINKATAKRYLLFSTVVLVASYLIELPLKRSCAFDGCIPTGSVSFTNAVFGLPAYSLFVLFVVGVGIWTARLVSVKRKTHI